MGWPGSAAIVASGGTEGDGWASRVSYLVMVLVAVGLKLEKLERPRARERQVKGGRAGGQ